MNIHYIKSFSGIMKIIEIVFVVTSFAILRDKEVGRFDPDAFYFGVGILVSCMINTPLLLICYLMGRMEIQQTIMEISVNGIFAVFLAVHGGMGLNYYASAPVTSQNNYGIAMASFSLAAALAYFADTILAAINFRPQKRPTI